MPPIVRAYNLRGVWAWCGRVRTRGETLAEPAGCRSPKAQVRRTGSSSGRDQRTSAQRGGSGSRSLPVAVRVTAQLSWRERAQSGIALPYMATYRSASVLLSSDGTRTPGTAALFAEPARKGGTPPWAGDFRPANSAGNGPKNAVGKTFTLELPDGSTGKVVVQSLKSGKGGVVLALMGEDAPPF